MFHLLLQPVLHCWWWVPVVLLCLFLSGLRCVAGNLWVLIARACDSVMDSFHIYTHCPDGNVKEATLPAGKAEIQKMFPLLALPDSLAIFGTSLSRCYVDEMESEGIFMFTEDSKPGLYLPFGRNSWGQTQTHLINLLARLAFLALLHSLPRCSRSNHCLGV